MSYCRWSEGDVYLYHTGKEYHFCTSTKFGSMVLHTKSAMDVLEWLCLIIENDGEVPQRALDRVKFDLEQEWTEEACAVLAAN